MNKISTEHWQCEVDEGKTSIRCCDKSDFEHGEEGGCTLSLRSISFNEEEERFMPKNISVPIELKAKCMKEGGSKICFFPRDIKTKREWENEDINQLAKKSPQTI